MNKKMIEIKFTNSNNEIEGLQEFFKYFLLAEYIFEYDNFTTIKDMFLWLEMHYRNKKELITDNELTEHYLILLNERYCKIRLDIRLKKFIEINKLINIQIYYVIGIGGGAGIKIDNLASIRINPNEQKHKEIPHVHIYKNNKIDYDHCVRINLNDLSQFKSDKKRIKDIFKNKEWNKVFDFLEKNREDLKKYYLSVQKGENPEPIYLDNNGEKILLK